MLYISGHTIHPRLSPVECSATIADHFSVPFVTFLNIRSTTHPNTERGATYSGVSRGGALGARAPP